MSHSFLQVCERTDFCPCCWSITTFRSSRHPLRGSPVLELLHLQKQNALFLPSMPCFSMCFTTKPESGGLLRFELYLLILGLMEQSIDGLLAVIFSYGTYWLTLELEWFIICHICTLTPTYGFSNIQFIGTRWHSTKKAATVEEGIEPISELQGWKQVLCSSPHIQVWDYSHLRKEITCSFFPPARGAVGLKQRNF